MHGCPLQELFSLLSEFLLVVDPAKRRTLAESLDHPFLKHAQLSKSKTGPLTYAVMDPTSEAAKSVTNPCATSGDDIMAGTTMCCESYVGGSRVA